MKKISLLLFFITFSSIGQKLNENVNSEIINKTLQSVNNIWIREIFENKYIKNENYFRDTDLLESVEQKNRVNNSNIMITSIKLFTNNADTLKLCIKALDFNKNYLELYNVKYGNSLKVKYNKESIAQIINGINNLPKIDTLSKLNITKFKIKELYENYEVKYNSLKVLINNNKEINPFVIEQFSVQEKNNKEYPYLLELINKAKNGTYEFEVIKKKTAKELRAEAEIIEKEELANEEKRKCDEEFEAEELKKSNSENSIRKLNKK